MKKIVHIGSQSIDANANTQAEINTIISSLVSAIPNLTHIAIGTYMDYDSGHANTQFSRWATAIHNVGKNVDFRSAGWNDWQGTNGVGQYTSSDFTTRHRSRLDQWIDDNFSIFKSGDIFECIPDEPENNSQWAVHYSGGLGGADGKAAYNALITGSRSDVDTALSNNGVTGIDTGYVHTSPSATKDVITQTTSDTLSADATDDYPESGDTTPVQMRDSMIEEINTWTLSAHPSPVRPKAMTFGPSVHDQLTEGDQALALKLEYDAIMRLVAPEEITVWQFGATDNAAKSRLFQHSGGVWTPREAARMLRTLFDADYAPHNTSRRIKVGSGMSMGGRAL